MCTREGCAKGTNKNRETQVNIVGSLTVCGCHGRPDGSGDQTILTFIFPFKGKGRIFGWEEGAPPPFGNFPHIISFFFPKAFLKRLWYVGILVKIEWLATFLSAFYYMRKNLSILSEPMATLQIFIIWSPLNLERPASQAEASAQAFD